MQANGPSTDQLGKIFIDIYRAGGSPSVLGRFATAHFGVEHPFLQENAFGEVIRALLASTDQPAVIGEFVCLQMLRARNDFQCVDLSAAHVEEPQAREVTSSGIAVRSKTMPLKIKINGRMTSVSVDRAGHDLYVSRYGIAGRSALLSRIAKMRLPPGATRSFLANREIQRANEAYGTVSPIRAV